MLWFVVIGIGAGILLYNSRRASAEVVPIPDLDRASHARRIPEGYVLSGIIGMDSVPVIRREGIRLVLSGAEPDPMVLAALSAAGIRTVDVHLGGAWDHGQEIRYWASQYPPEQTMVHCYHGVDRTGNIIAHLLITRHGWDVADAFYAVVSPTSDQVEALADILAEFGIDDRRRPNDPGVGIYSLRAIGMSGGMKAAGDFGNMIRQNISEISSL